MADLQLQIRLISDTTFGRGDGMAGVVDQEVEHDPVTGLPFIKGRTLKGLLVEECANILYALDQTQSPAHETMKTTALRLFGKPGSDLTGQAIIHIGTATLPADISRKVRQEIANNRLAPQDVLDALTTVRYQTAVDSERDTPKDNTLRAMRVILRETEFSAPIIVRESLTSYDQALLAACAASLRRAGLSRNRGRGRIAVAVSGLEGNALANFAQRVRGES